MEKNSTFAGENTGVYPLEKNESLCLCSHPQMRHRLSGPLKYPEDFSKAEWTLTIGAGACFHCACTDFFN